jgi:hypothetical protein
MDSAKSQLAEKLKSANNILVTVSRDPSVDQLAACIGITLLLNKLNKHAAAIFSGQIPSTIEFLQPEATLEKNTDSLRDFIISLDKSKADKLRYKVEDNVVRIFITPYKTSIGQHDLEFSEGDFNVDVVLAIGVHQQEDLDMAITAHGRILHDATVTSINITNDGGLGTINWHDPQASSLSELVTELGQVMGKDLIDGQIATALLTGIVAETDRFSNEKTSSQTMSVSSTLMAAGANQQLVATKLEEPRPVPKHESYQPNSNPPKMPPYPAEDVKKHEAGTLEIKHDNPPKPPLQQAAPYIPPKEPHEDWKQAPMPPQMARNPEPPLEHEFPKIKFDEAPVPTNNVWKMPAGDHLSPGSGLMKEAPSMSGTLTANFQPEVLDPATDPFGQSVPGAGKLLDHSGPVAQQAPPQMPQYIQDPPAAPALPPPPPVPATEPPQFIPAPVSTAQPTSQYEPVMPGMTPAPPVWAPPSDDPFSMDASNDTQTLSEIEKSVDSPHLHFSDVDAARDQVNRALDAAAGSGDTDPIQALNSQPLGDPLHDQFANPSTNASVPVGYQQPFNPDNFSMPDSTSSDATSPPPVPPPMPFQFGDPGSGAG